MRVRQQLAGSGKQLLNFSNSQPHLAATDALTAAHAKQHAAACSCLHAAATAAAAAVGFACGTMRALARSFASADR
jgi:hypothetical protein